MKPQALFFLIIQLSFFSVSAQSLNEALGAVKTNFQIFSDTTDMRVTDQFIIKRAEKNSYLRHNYQHETGYEPGYGYGYSYAYGYESLHLEFVTENTYTIKYDRNNNDKFELTFYDLNNKILDTRVLDFSLVDLSYHYSQFDAIRFFYSIDLIDIPIVMLDETVKIDLIKMLSDKRYKQ